MILAIGNSGTYEFEAFRMVSKELEKLGEKTVLFKQDMCLEGEYLSFEVASGKPIYCLVIDGVSYNAEDFRAIWYLKPHLPRELLEYDPPDYRQFIHAQFYQMRKSLWTLFRHKRWVSDPWAMYRAEDKLYQLATAAGIGLEVPDTLITSDPDRVRAFYHKHNARIITKVIVVSPILDHVLMTEPVTSEALENIEDLVMAPAIFQSKVEKAYDLRVTVVGEKIFAAKIHSQEDEETALDWRRKPALNDFDVRMEPTTLPTAVSERILRLLEKMGLRFGCIDMAITPNGDYVFFEINPNGQWYFVQLRTGFDIAKAIAGLLAVAR